MQTLLPLARPSPRLPGRTWPMAHRLALTAFVHLSFAVLLALAPARPIGVATDRGEAAAEIGAPVRCGARRRPVEID
jgi:hypothetical protein